MAHQLSSRGSKAVTPALPYIGAFLDAQKRPWSPSDPDGSIICTVAENKLSAGLFHERLVSAQAELPLHTLFYPKGFKGTEEARAAMARMLQRTCMKGAQVDPSHLSLVSGAGSVLETVFWSICESGQGALLPKPIYPAFRNDLGVRSNVQLVLLDLVEPGQTKGLASWLTPSPHKCDAAADGVMPPPAPLSVAQQLDAAKEGAAAQGITVRAFLLSHPNNPCGTVYQADTVLQILQWCLANDCHFVSDEIYANSVWGEQGPEFTSALLVAQRALEDGSIPREEEFKVHDLLHVVWGLSKDWCASGLRVGGLHSRNPALNSAIDNLCYFQMISGPTLWSVTQVMEDDEFVDNFIAENKRRLRAAYAKLAGALDEAGIPHVPACAAMFSWVDLRRGLRMAGWEGERELWQRLVDCGVVLTPGEACLSDEPGFFRICWAWVDPDALPIAVSRITAQLEAEGPLKPTGSPAATDADFRA
ncbi:pyridoxal phosphate-dependent transferase [Haematococcus lacustris]